MDTHKWNCVQIWDTSKKMFPAFGGGVKETRQLPDSLPYFDASVFSMISNVDDITTRRVTQKEFIFLFCFTWNKHKKRRRSISGGSFVRFWLMRMLRTLATSFFDALQMHRFPMTTAWGTLSGGGSEQTKSPILYSVAMQLLFSSACATSMEKARISTFGIKVFSNKSILLVSAVRIPMQPTRNFVHDQKMIKARCCVCMLQHCRLSYSTERSWTDTLQNILGTGWKWRLVGKLDWEHISRDGQWIDSVMNQSVFLCTVWVRAKWVRSNCRRRTSALMSSLAGPGNFLSSWSFQTEIRSEEGTLPKAKVNEQQIGAWFEKEIKLACPVKCFSILQLTEFRSHLLWKYVFPQCFYAPFNVYSFAKRSWYIAVFWNVISRLSLRNLCTRWKCIHGLFAWYSHALFLRSNRI